MIRRSRSGPPTPSRLHSRLKASFRRHLASSNSKPASPPVEEEISRFPRNKDRRKLARETYQHEGDCGSPSDTSSLPSSPSEGDVTGPLAMGSLMVAADELDRLSANAREQEFIDEAWENESQIHGRERG